MPESNLTSTGKNFAMSVVLISFLGGCSQLPDSINPVEWYNSSVDFFTDKDIEPQLNKNQERNLNSGGNGKKDVARDKGKKFPTIASVDQQRDYYEARKRGGLVPDNENRNYAPAIARQGETSSRLATAPPPEPKPKAPKPVAKAKSPKSAVTQETGLSALTPSSPPTSAEQKTLQARLQQRLNEIRARAGQPPKALLTSNLLASPNSNFGTVIVNSEGATNDQTYLASSTAREVNEKTVETYLPKKFGGINRLVTPLKSEAVKVATIHFRNGSAALSARDRQIIANALQLKRERGGRIHVIGHASSRTRSLDPIRHKMLNFNISVDRADAVAQELIRLGAESDDLVVDAISDSKPMYFEFMPTGEAGNRRAEIYLES